MKNRFKDRTRLATADEEEYVEQPVKHISNKKKLKNLGLGGIWSAIRAEDGNIWVNYYGEPCIVEQKPVYMITPHGQPPVPIEIHFTPVDDEPWGFGPIEL